MMSNVLRLFLLLCSNIRTVERRPFVLYTCVMNVELKLTVDKGAMLLKVLFNDVHSADTVPRTLNEWQEDFKRRYL